MTCEVDGCARPVGRDGLCRAHHERRRRHGDVMADKPIAERGRPRRKSHGYVVVYAPGHPLAEVSGMTSRVYEHRLVLWDAVDGNDQPCHVCGKHLLWNIDLHVDHLDGDQTNNDRGNLAAVCDRCNVTRRPKLGRLTVDGAAAREWAAAQGYKVGARGPLPEAVILAWRHADARDDSADSLIVS